MKSQPRRATIYFEAAVHRALKRLAAETGRTVSQLANQAVKSLLEGGNAPLTADSPLTSLPPAEFRPNAVSLSLGGGDMALLAEIASRTGRKAEDLIGRAVSGLIRDYRRENRLGLLREGKGLWEGREDLPDFRALRREGDRA